MIFGYARDSTTVQNLDAQLDALKATGAERIFQEKITGATRARAELDAMLQQTRKGDVVVVTKLDRLRPLSLRLDRDRHGAQGSWRGFPVTWREYRHDDADRPSHFPCLRFTR